MKALYDVRDHFREFGRYCPDTHRYIAEPPPAADIPVWRAWLFEQGIDPDQVKLTRWIERRTHEGHCQIVWLQDDPNNDTIHVEHHINLQQPPPPFPLP